MFFKPLFFASVALLAGQTASEKANVSIMTSRVLSLTAQARQAITINNKEAARLDVSAALELADRVLRASHSPLAPIYTELEEVSVIEPVQAAKARQSGQADRQPGAPAPDAVVQTTTGTFTSVSLDVVRAKEQLTVAKTAIENGKLPEADSALTAVQVGVVLKRVETDLPLIKARQNLIHARSLLSQGRAEASAVPLKAAADALLEYQTMPMVEHAGDAMRLQREIEANVSSASADKIDNWWNQVAAWMDAA